MARMLNPTPSRSPAGLNSRSKPKPKTNMKRILMSAFAMMLFAIVALPCMAQTVTLTPDQASKLNSGVDSFVLLLPASCQKYVVPVLGLIGLLATLGRLFVGWRNNGLPGAIAGLFGGTNTPKTPNTTKGATAIMSMLLFAFMFLPGAVRAQSTNSPISASPVPTAATTNSLVQDVEQVGVDAWNDLKGIQFTNGLNVSPYGIYHSGDLGAGLAISTANTNGLNVGFECAAIDQSEPTGGKQWDFYDGAVSLQYKSSVVLPLVNISVDYTAETGMAANLNDPNTVYSQTATLVSKTWHFSGTLSSLTVGGGIGYLSAWSQPYYPFFISGTF